MKLFEKKMKREKKWKRKKFGGVVKKNVIKIKIVSDKLTWKQNEKEMF